MFQRYLINLSSSKDRLQTMKDRLGKLEIPFERVEAIDARTLSEDQLQLNKTPSIEYPYPLTLGELACFLSHRKCWQKFIDSDSDWALIFEDHCDFSPLAKSYFQTTDWIPKECGLVQFVFSDNPVYLNRQIKLKDGNILLQVSCSSPVGCSAYFISKKVAQLALEESQYIYSPVDNFLFGSWSDFSKKINYWRLLGAIVKRDENVKTTIHNRESITKRKNFYLQRWIRKLLIKVRRLSKKKIDQYWYSE